MSWDALLQQVNRSCMATFGVPVVYRPALRNRPEMGEQPLDVVGIFDERHSTFTLSGAGEGGFETIVPRTTLELRSSDLGFEPLAGDTVMVDGVSYQVTDVQPDSRGASVLFLTREAGW